MKTNGNEPATGYASDNRHEKGLTKREQFAMVAMQGYIAADHNRFHKNIAKEAVAMADALINSLNEQP